MEKICNSIFRGRRNIFIDCLDSLLGVFEIDRLNVDFIEFSWDVLELRFKFLVCCCENSIWNVQLNSWFFTLKYFFFYNLWVVSNYLPIINLINWRIGFEIATCQWVVLKPRRVLLLYCRRPPHLWSIIVTILYRGIELNFLNLELLSLLPKYGKLWFFSRNVFFYLTDNKSKAKLFKESLIDCVCTPEKAKLKPQTMRNAKKKIFYV